MLSWLSFHSEMSRDVLIRRASRYAPFPNLAVLSLSPPPCHLVLLCMIFFLADTGEFRTESMDLRSILPIFLIQFLVLSELAAFLVLARYRARFRLSVFVIL